MRNSLDFYTSGAANTAYSRVKRGKGEPLPWKGCSLLKITVLER